MSRPILVIGAADALDAYLLLIPISDVILKKTSPVYVGQTSLEMRRNASVLTIPGFDDMRC